ncbi:MAG: SDR family oxidoreductase [Saprospiraceae bacterium]|nr:SDR family oxidoreductase [Saprospiraceae bacterium]
MEKKEFDQKVVVVTGGSKGIGKSTAEYFLEKGASVSVWDITEWKGSLSEKMLFIQCNVSKEIEIQQALSATLAAFNKINILVNNAGIQRYATVTESSESEWDEVMNVNLKSAFLCSKHCIPFMQSVKKGVIINVSNVQAFISQQNVAAYTTSKTALLGLTRSIAVDFAPAIRCVAVCPGTIDTPMLRDAIQLSPNPAAVLQECNDMHLSGRIGTPEEVAALIGFLASDSAGFMTGQAVRIDGGLGISIPGSKRD